MKAAREKQQITYRETTQMTMDFLSETMKAICIWHKVYQVMKEKELSIQNSMPVTISFRNEGKINMFSNEGKLREIVTSTPTLK